MSNRTKKPHWILRTHDGVPVPPAWASGYCVAIRGDNNPDEAFDLQHFPLDGWEWSIDGWAGDIVAIRWLP